MNIDKRKSDKTNLAELRETFSALQLKYETDTHDLRTKLLAEQTKLKDFATWVRTYPISADIRKKADAVLGNK